MTDRQGNVVRDPTEHKGKFPLDENVIKGNLASSLALCWCLPNRNAELPDGCKVLDSVCYGAFAWTRTARVSVQLADGSTKDYTEQWLE